MRMSPQREATAPTWETKGGLVTFPEYVTPKWIEEFKARFPNVEKEKTS